jgi:hypothetical protein
MKLQINERNDSSKLIKLFNDYKKKGYYPMWNDPYCEFVVHTKQGVLRYRQENNGKLHKSLVEI